MMKKLLLILICLFVSFEVKSDVVEELNKTNNVSRLEYSLDKLIPELESEIFDDSFDFKDNSRYEYYDKGCSGGIGKINFKEYKTDKEMIIIGCGVKIRTQSMYKDKKIPDEQQSQNFNYLENELMEILADKIVMEGFYQLGNTGEFINIPLLLSKFDNQYNLNKFLRKSKVTKIQEDYVTLLKERIIFSVVIDIFNRDGTYISENFYYPFSQKWELPSKGIPKFEKIKLKKFEMRGKP